MIEDLLSFILCRHVYAASWLCELIFSVSITIIVSYDCPLHPGSIKEVFTPSLFTISNG